MVSHKKSSDFFTGTYEIVTKERILKKICFDKELGRQMRFITGPMQSGKTT